MGVVAGCHLGHVIINIPSLNLRSLQMKFDSNQPSGFWVKMFRYVCGSQKWDLRYKVKGLLDLWYLFMTKVSLG